MADSNTGGKRKRSKAFYVGQKKKVRYLICGLVSSNYRFCGNNLSKPLSPRFFQKKGQELLTPGMKGVIVTCNEREKLCIKEAYNVLNEVRF